MIFAVGDHIEQIISRAKSQTRRVSKSGFPVRYELGKSYAIQHGRGKPAIPDGRIVITNIRIELRAHDVISVEDAKAEGGYTPEEYERLFCKMHLNWIWRYAYTFKFVSNKRAIVSGDRRDEAMDYHKVALSDF